MSKSKTPDNLLINKSASELRGMAQHLPRPRYGGLSPEASKLLVHAAQHNHVDLFLYVAQHHWLKTSYYEHRGELMNRISRLAPKWLTWVALDQPQELHRYVSMARSNYDVDWASAVSTGKMTQETLSYIFYASLFQGKALCPMDLLLDKCKGVIEPLSHSSLYNLTAGQMNYSAYSYYASGDEKSYKLANKIPTEKLKECDLTPLLKGGMYATAYIIGEHLKLNNGLATCLNKVAPSDWEHTARSLNQMTKVLGHSQLKEFKDFLLEFLDIRKIDTKKQTSLHMATSLLWPHEVALEFVQNILDSKPILAYQQNKEGKRIIDNPKNALVSHIVSFTEKRGLNNALKHQVKKRKKKRAKEEDLPPIPTRKRRM